MSDKKSLSEKRAQQSDGAGVSARHVQKAVDRLYDKKKNKDKDKNSERKNTLDGIHQRVGTKPAPNESVVEDYKRLDEEAEENRRTVERTTPQELLLSAETLSKIRKETPSEPEQSTISQDGIDSEASHHEPGASEKSQHYTDSELEAHGKIDYYYQRMRLAAQGADPNDILEEPSIFQIMASILVKTFDRIAAMLKRFRQFRQEVKELLTPNALRKLLRYLKNIPKRIKDALIAFFMTIFTNPYFFAMFLMVVYYVMMELTGGWEIMFGGLSNLEEQMEKVKNK